MDLKDLSSEFEGSGITHAWHLAYYIPRGHDPDEISQRILDFKSGSPIYVKRWSHLALTAFIGADLKFDWIVRALGSTELKAPAKPRVALDYLGEAVALASGAKYSPESIIKTHPTSKLAYTHNLQERREALRDAYAVDKNTLIKDRQRVLIVDDVTTSGTSGRAISHQLLKLFPHLDISLFALAKTAYDAKLNAGLTI